MKKIILIFIVLFCLLGCEEYTRYNMTANVTYEIVYPDTTIRYNDNFNFNSVGENNANNIKIIVYSSKGTNYIGTKSDWNYFVSNTCPMRVIDYKVNSNEE